MKSYFLRFSDGDYRYAYDCCWDDSADSRDRRVGGYASVTFFRDRGSHRTGSSIDGSDLSCRCLCLLGCGLRDWWEALGSCHNWSANNCNRSYCGYC